MKPTRLLATGPLLAANAARLSTANATTKACEMGSTRTACADLETTSLKTCGGKPAGTLL